MSEGRDPLEFLDETPAQEADAPEQIEEAPAEADPPVVLAEPEPEKGEQADPPPAEQKEIQNVPLSHLLDEREKRQAATRRAEDLQRQLEELSRERAEQPHQPDFYDNPQEAIEQRFAVERVRISKASLEATHGPEKIAELQGWLSQSPERANRFLMDPLPFQSALKAFEAEQKQKQALELFDKTGGDLDAFIEKALQERLAQAAPATPQQPQNLPPSMARAPRVGGDAVSPGSGFDALFSG